MLYDSSTDSRLALRLLKDAELPDVPQLKLIEIESEGELQHLQNNSKGIRIAKLPVFIEIGVDDNTILGGGSVGTVVKKIKQMLLLRPPR